MQESLIQSVNTANFEMRYAKFGHGNKVLVIIPGLSLKSVLDSAETVAKAYQIFHDDYTVYLFDRKQNIGDVYPVSEMAKDIAEALKAMGIEHADIFGTSQGGMIAQHIAIEYPELVNKMILASSSSRAEPLQLEVIGGWAIMARENRVEDLLNSFIDNVYSEAFAKRYRRALLVMFKNLSPEDIRRFAVTAEACAGINTYDNLGKIKCPTFVIGAAHDHVVAYEASVKIAEKLKSENVPFEFYTYEDLGHAAFDEAKDYKERVLEFLKK